MTDSLPRKLNLGCGKYLLPGYHNVDSRPETHPDQFVDLDVLPLPFADNAFDEVRADHVLEHLRDPFGVMAELHRICSPGAVIRIKVPHFSRGFTHADHKCGFDVAFPYYFNPAFQPGYTGHEMRLEYQRLRWFGQPYMKKDYLPRPAYWAACAAGAVIDVFANISPMICSRLWCFWVGGFEEYEMRFRVVKPGGSPRL
jgi:SAM-dependent methyltransferase